MRLIYSGNGVSPLSLSCLRAHFNATPMLATTLHKLSGASCLIMPGGADLPYLQDLGAVGIETIKDFVNKGGTYLGVCAGAYFGAKSIYFRGQDKDFIYVIEGARLGLCDALALGSIPLNNRYYEEGARTHLRLKSNIECLRRSFYYHGGPFFIVSDPSIVLASYAINGMPAIITAKFGHGRVILSGVHFEVTQEAYKLVYGMDDVYNGFSDNDEVTQFINKLLG